MKIVNKGAWMYEMFQPSSFDCWTLSPHKFTLEIVDKDRVNRMQALTINARH
jgi:hypothetical protein